MPSDPLILCAKSANFARFRNRAKWAGKYRANPFLKSIFFQNFFLAPRAFFSISPKSIKLS